MADRPDAPRALSQISVASAKVAAIVEAAERAAEDLRLKTEEKVRARIAEADRAVELRVEAGEAEARDIVAQARRDAEELISAARRDVQGVHDEAARARSDAEAEAAAMRLEVEEYGKEARAAARDDARAIVAEAQDAARGVLTDGTELSGHLSELSESLRRNAERLLNDVKLAHARLTADLDQHSPPGTSNPSASPAASRPARGSRNRPSGDADDFSVPEFLPHRP
jgi:cell division septum initiation protein DivIVA